MAGCVTSNGSANSITVASPDARRARIARRVGSASAAKAPSRFGMPCPCISAIFYINECLLATEMQDVLPRRAFRDWHSASVSGAQPSTDAGPEAAYEGAQG